MPLPSWLRAALPEDWRNGGFGLYVHWPFCLAKCPYCDFNSHVCAQIDLARWKRAYVAEIRRAGEQAPGRVLNSIYLGGGTPSLMAPDLVDVIIGTARKTWAFSNRIEITLEANPTSVEADRFRAFREAGVNRVSVGVQALNDRDLARLGRMHTAKEAMQAFETARTVFDRANLDLIYARQDQTLAAWQEELMQATELAADHLSLYQLTIEEGTAFARRLAQGGLRGLPHEDLAADMYLATQEICEQAGFPAYEISNHARRGSESRHNLVYWRAGDYAGVGPGAHGRLTIGENRHATQAAPDPARWLDRVEKAGSGEHLCQRLSDIDRATEYLMMGMRITEGISLDRLGRWISLDDLEKPIVELVDLGMVRRSSGQLCATPKGRPVLNAVLRKLLSAV